MENYVSSKINYGWTSGRIAQWLATLGFETRVVIFHPFILTHLQERKISLPNICTNIQCRRVIFRLENSASFAAAAEEKLSGKPRQLFTRIQRGLLLFLPTLDVSRGGLILLRVCAEERYIKMKREEAETRPDIPTWPNLHVFARKKKIYTTCNPLSMWERADCVARQRSVFILFFPCLLSETIKFMYSSPSGGIFSVSRGRHHTTPFQFCLCLPEGGWKETFFQKAPFHASHTNPYQRHLHPANNVVTVVFMSPNPPILCSGGGPSTKLSDSQRMSTSSFDKWNVEQWAWRQIWSLRVHKF